MMKGSILAILCAMLAWPARAQEANVTTFTASFFQGAQPANALEMVQRLPGFTFSGGDSDVRGFAGASGNVLIDGRRPASKTDGVEQLLARIPTASVERIELIRGGARGIDMAGQSILANVVRSRATAVRVRQELGAALILDGRVAPLARLEVSRRAGDRLTEGALSMEREVDDETGNGPRFRSAPDGALIRDTRYREAGGTTRAKASAAHERALAGGRLRANVALERELERVLTNQTRTLPRPANERNVARENEISGELGLNWDKSLPGGLTVELAGVHNISQEKSREVNDTDGSLERLLQTSRGRESVQRGLLRWQSSAKLTLEGGAEASYTALDSATRLFDAGGEVALPAGAVKVVELRGEAFGTASWRPNARIVVEGSGRFELSQLKQTGDTRLTKIFRFLKPRMQLSWRVGSGTQLRLTAERTIGQLDFGDFVSSASLTLGTVTVGNADLEPDKRITLSAAIEQNFGDGGALVLTARHIAITDVIDRLPVIGPDFAFDAPGNIGDGRIDRLEANLTLPLGGIGIAGGLLKATGAAQRTAVTDPTTGARRRISSEPPFTGELHFTQDRPKIGLRWGIDVIWAEYQRQFRFNEIRRDATGTRIDLFGEYRFSPTWTLRAYANNITGRAVRQERLVWDGPRSTRSFAFDEMRRLDTRAQFGLLVRRTFGRLP